MNEREVRDAVVFWKKQVEGSFVIGTVVWLGVTVVFLWGLRDLRFAAAWSVGALAYSAWVFLRGWNPWRMWLYEWYRGSRVVEGDDVDFQGVVMRFLHSRRSRATGALIIATAALTPWVLLLLTELFHGKHFGYGPSGVPIWSFAVLGFADALSRSMLAMMYWIDETMERWPSFRREYEGGVA